MLIVIYSVTITTDQNRAVTRYSSLEEKSVRTTVYVLLHVRHVRPYNAPPVWTQTYYLKRIMKLQNWIPSFNLFFFVKCLRNIDWFSLLSAVTLFSITEKQLNYGVELWPQEVKLCHGITWFTYHSLHTRHKNKI